MGKVVGSGRYRSGKVERLIERIGDNEWKGPPPKQFVCAPILSTGFDGHRCKFLDWMYPLYFCQTAEPIRSLSFPVAAAHPLGTERRRG